MIREEHALSIVRRGCQFSSNTTQISAP